MPYASALTRLEDPRIKEIGQTEVGLSGKIAYDDEYTGPALDPAEGARLAAVIGDKTVLFMANHGICDGRRNRRRRLRPALLHRARRAGSDLRDVDRAETEAASRARGREDPARFQAATISTRADPGAAAFRCAEAHPRPQGAGLRDVGWRLVMRGLDPRIHHASQSLFRSVMDRAGVNGSGNDDVATGSPTRSLRSTPHRSAASVRSAWLGLSDCSSSVLAVRRFNSFTITSPSGGLHHHAVAAADRRARRHHDDVAVAIGGLHRVAGDLQRIGVLVIGRGQRDLVPALAGRKAAVVEIAAGAGLREAEQRHRLRAARAPSPINCTKVSIEALVAASAFATDSVDGQRSRPSAVMRLDLLKVVGSRPGACAKPGGRQARRARPADPARSRSGRGSAFAGLWAV